MGHMISKEYRQKHLLEVAKNVALAAHKAPLLTGRTAVETEIFWGEDLDPILEVMQLVGRIFRFAQADYVTIKGCIEKGEPPVVVYIGTNVGRSELAWNCGACGFDTCKEFNQYSASLKGGSGLLGGPSCNWKAIDYGIACDWACAAAWHYKVDNRVMGSLGAPASFLGIMPSCNVKIGLAIGPPRDLTYYSREEMHKLLTYEMDKMDILRTIPTLFSTFPGGGNPTYKVKDRWWETPEMLKFEPNMEALETISDSLFVKLPEVVTKYGDKIAARYKDKEAMFKKGK